MPFDPQAYLDAHPDLQNNWNTDPNYATQYGDVLNYALADAAANGTSQEKADINSGQITVPAGFSLEGNQQSTELTPGQGQPLEQNVLQTVLPRLLGDISGDAGRRTIANGLASSVLGGTAAANTQLARAQGGGFDAQTYLQNYPNVQQAFNGLNNGTTPGTKSVSTPQGVKDMTAAQFAEYHYLNFGQQQGYKPAYTMSSQLAQDFNNADTTTAANIAASNQATQTQLAALSQATTQLQQNLTGSLAAKAGALQQQLQSLNQNLDQLDASQRAALTQQIATQQKDLEDSIATQRKALETQIAALGTAATTEAQAKKAALEQEIQGLTAAQAPLNAARVAAADLQATAINIGLQRTQDQLTAENARAGFVGGSTAQDAALARATIDARQNAAQAMGNANVQNATDTRDIGFRGASGQRTIADALSTAQRDIAGQSATGNAALTNSLAQQRQNLGDTQAAGLGAIANNTATSRAGIGAYGANTTYGNTTTGADQARSISDAFAQGQYGLTATNAANTLAAQQQGNAAKATYYDNNYNRSLAAAVAPGAIASNAASSLTALDNYANSGLGRTLNTLNWWSTNQSAAPTPGAVAVQPSTTGNSLSNLGAGLLSGAINYGNSQNWWQTPKVNGTATPSSSSSTGYLTPGGNVGVQTSWGG